MRNVNFSTCGRLALALTAIMAVAGSGLVFAAGPGPSYPRPQSARIVGPGTVSPSSINTYTLFVTFVGGSTATITAPPVMFSASAGSFTGGNYSAPSSTTPKVLLTGIFTSSGAIVTANRAISVQ